jgi:hypothetical protein
MSTELKYTNNTINDVIVKSLMVAVLQNKPKIFLYHLLANNVETTFPNKLRFYEFFTIIMVSYI